MRKIAISISVLAGLVAGYTGFVGSKFGEVTIQPGNSDAKMTASVSLAVESGDRAGNYLSATLTSGNLSEAFLDRVVDGDTIKVILAGGNEETVRILGINAPESVALNRPVECFGKEAAATARQFFGFNNGSSTLVFLERDLTQSNRDKYGRLLRYVYFEGEDIGLILISEGFAYEYTYNRPYEKQASYKTAQSEARLLGKGLWAAGACQGSR